MHMFTGALFLLDHVMDKDMYFHRKTEFASPNRNFVRGHEATSSVKLRRRKDGPAAEASGAKKRNRHSGDFLYWTTQRPQPQQQQQQPDPNEYRHRSQYFRQSNDWASVHMNGLPSFRYPSIAEMDPVSMPPIVNHPGNRSSMVANARSAEVVSRVGDLVDEKTNPMETLDRKIPPSNVARPEAANNDIPDDNNKVVFRRYQQFTGQQQQQHNRRSGGVFPENVLEQQTMSKQQRMLNRRSCDFASHQNLQADHQYLSSLEPTRNGQQSKRASTHLDIQSEVNGGVSSSNQKFKYHMPSRVERKYLKVG